MTVHEVPSKEPFTSVMKRTDEDGFDNWILFDMTFDNDSRGKRADQGDTKLQDRMSVISFQCVRKRFIHPGWPSRAS